MKIEEPRRTGLLGEMYAAQYLRRKGYAIYAANYKCRCGEIDLIAEKDGILCVVEVKTRREGACFAPAEAVDLRKEENVRGAAASYTAAAKLKMPVRFDILEVIVMEKQHKIKHIKNAF